MPATRSPLEVVDHLLCQDLGIDDLLLDFRNELVKRDEPGICLEKYFQVRDQLSRWYSRELSELRGGIEESIMLEIELSQERQRRCLGLETKPNLRLVEYCEEQMQKTAREFKSEPTIKLRFCWS